MKQELDRRQSVQPTEDDLLDSILYAVCVALIIAIFVWLMAGAPKVEAQVGPTVLCQLDTDPLVQGVFQGACPPGWSLVRILR